MDAGQFSFRIVFCFSMTVLLSGCAGGLPNSVNGLDRVRWQFIESVGGMAIGDPYHDRAANIIRVPIIQDFSGNLAITREPTLMDSGVNCHHINASVSTNFLGVVNIHLIAWATPDAVDSTGCDEVLIIPPPLTASTFKFKVWYRDSRFQLDKYLVGEFSL